MRLNIGAEAPPPPMPPRLVRAQTEEGKAALVGTMLLRKVLNSQVPAQLQVLWLAELFSFSGERGVSLYTVVESSRPGFFLVSSLRSSFPRYQLRTSLKK